jgi:hypothetical protein
MHDEPGMNDITQAHSTNFIADKSYRAERSQTSSTIRNLPSKGKVGF